MKEVLEDKHDEYHFDPPPHISDIEIEILRRKLPSPAPHPDDREAMAEYISDCDRLAEWAD